MVLQCHIVLTQCRENMDMDITCRSRRIQIIACTYIYTPSVSLGIVEVYRLAKRVFCSLKHTDPGTLTSTPLLQEISSICNHLSHSSIFELTILLVNYFNNSADAVDTRQVESIHKHWKTLVNTLPNNIMVRVHLS